MDEIDYLKNILYGIVDNPEAIEVIRTQDDRGVLLSVSAGRNDMGKIIGKKGETAHAIRTLMKAYGYRIKSVLAVKINEPR